MDRIEIEATVKRLAEGQVIMLTRDEFESVRSNRYTVDDPPDQVYFATHKGVFKMDAKDLT